MVAQTLHVMELCGSGFREYVGFCCGKIHTEVTGTGGIHQQQDSCNAGL